MARINLGRVVGRDGKEITLQSNGTYLQWKYVGDENWQNLVELSTLNGADGNDGIGINNIQINQEGELVITYTNDVSSNLGIIVGRNGENGQDGRGIVSITKTDTEGLVDTYTINYTDNTTSTFTIINGSSGSGSGSSNYNELTNKPSIGNVELQGNKSLLDLGAQERLISGTNIKTINNTSILGEGNINVEGTSMNTRLYTFNEAYNRWCAGESFPIAFCGDSTIAGYGTSQGKANAWVARLEEKLKYECNNSNVKLYNLAESGSVTPAVSQFTTWFGTNGNYNDTKLVGIGWGINDRLGKASRKAYYQDQYNKVEALILKAFEYNIQPFLLTSQSTIEPGVASNYTSTYPLRTSSNINICANNARRDLAKKYNLEIIDMNVLTELYLKNSKVAINTIIPDRLHFGNIGNLFEGGAAFSKFVNRTIKVNDKEKLIVNYADQRVTHCVPEDYVSYGGDLKIYVDRENYGANIKIFDVYIYIKDQPATISAYKKNLNSDTYIKVDQEVPELSNIVELEDLKTDLDELDIGLHHFEVYTGNSAIADFCGFIVNDTNSVQTTSVQAIEFGSNLYTIGENQPLQTSIIFTPSFATNKTVTYTTTGGTISPSGVFQATTAGTYTVTATSEDGGKTATCTVNVVAPVSVTGVSLNKNTNTMSEGDKLQLIATVAPGNATNKAVTWTANNDLCTVNSNGMVTCNSSSSGTSIITVSTVDGNYTDTCTINIVRRASLLVDSTGLAGGTNKLDSFSNTIVPSALWFNYNSSDQSTLLSGKTLTSMQFKTATGDFTFGKVDLTKYSTQAISIIDPQTITITSDDILEGIATVNLNNLQIGEHETLAFTVGSDTAQWYYNTSCLDSNNTYELKTAQAYAQGATNTIGFACKIYGYES